MWGGEEAQNLKIRKQNRHVWNHIKQLHIGQTKIKLASSEMEWKQPLHVMLIYPHNHEL